MLWYNASGPAGCLTTPPVLTATFQEKWTVMAEDSLPEGRAAYQRAYYEANREKLKARSRAYYEANKEACRRSKADWKARNPERVAADIQRQRERITADPARAAAVREQLQKFRKNNPDKITAWVRRRQAAQMRRTPAWLTPEDHAAMLAVYTEAVRLTRETGIPHEVDHIIPMLGRAVSGLHVPANLQILTRTANRSKGNKHGD